MEVLKSCDLGNGHKIEFGYASWDKKAKSVRNRYPTATGGFSPRSSSEIPLKDVKTIVEKTLEQGLLDNQEIIEIMDACLRQLKKTQI